MRNAFRISIRLGLTLPLLLAGPAAWATLDLGPANDTINEDAGFRDASPGGNTDAIVKGNVEDSLATLSTWRINGTSTRVPDSTWFAKPRRPEFFRRLPSRRTQSVNSPSGIPINDIPSLPEPSSIIAASLLLLPFGASALRIVRKRQGRRPVM